MTAFRVNTKQCPALPAGTFTRALAG